MPPTGMTTVLLLLVFTVCQSSSRTIFSRSPDGSFKAMGANEKHANTTTTTNGLLLNTTHQKFDSFGPGDKEPGSKIHLSNAEVVSTANTSSRHFTKDAPQETMSFIKSDIKENEDQTSSKHSANIFEDSHQGEALESLRTHDSNVSDALAKVKPLPEYSSRDKEPITIKSLHTLKKVSDKATNENSQLDHRRKSFGSQDHIVQSAFGDDDLEMVKEYVSDAHINKTGQLRYSALSVVEKSLIKDVVRTIMKNDEYMLLLDNPSFPKIVNMIKEMVRGPNQKVLQRQIWSKLLAVRAYYKKYYKPFNNQQSKNDALELLKHLGSASESNQLTVEDTVKLGERMKNLAFLIQETTFDEKLNELEKKFKTEDDSKTSIRDPIETTTQKTSDPGEDY